MDSVLGPRGGPESPFWASLVPMWPHSAPQADFWTILGLIFGDVLNPKYVKFGVDFRCVFAMFFGGVLEWFWGCFWVTFWYQKDDQKQKGRFVKMLVLRK